MAPLEAGRSLDEAVHTLAGDEPADAEHERGVGGYAESGTCFQPRGLVAGCRCSRDRVAGTLMAFPKDEVADMMEDGVISVRCEFCGEDYRFDAAALDALFAAS